ncbi:MAG: hypothetical protein QXH17_03275 [Candidatus Bathyarchaeia archaeon]
MSRVQSTSKLQLHRVCSGMKGKVRYICRKLSFSSGLRVKNGFLWFEKPNFRLTIRRPDPKDPRTMRELKHIPQEEIILAFLSILKEALSLRSESLITQVGKTFGFQRITSRNKAFLERVLSKLLEDGVIVDKGGRLSIASIQDTDLEGGLKSLTS